MSFPKPFSPPLFLRPSEGSLRWNPSRYSGTVLLGGDGGKRECIGETASRIRRIRAASCSLLFSIEPSLPPHHVPQTPKSLFEDFSRPPGQLSRQQAGVCDKPTAITPQEWQSTSTATAAHTPSPSSSPPSHELHNIICLPEVGPGSPWSGEDNMSDLEYLPDLVWSPTSSLAPTRPNTPSHIAANLLPDVFSNALSEILVEDIDGTPGFCICAPSYDDCLALDPVVGSEEELDPLEGLVGLRIIR